MAPDVTNQDEMTNGNRLSQSVTSTRQIELYLLQIETNRRHPNRKSQSVTPDPLLAAKMLQIKTSRELLQRGRAPLWWSRSLLFLRLCTSRFAAPGHLILEQPCTGRPTIACSLRVGQTGLFIGILDTLAHKIVELGLVAFHDIGRIAGHDVDARTLIALVTRIVRDITQLCAVRSVQLDGRVASANHVVRFCPIGRISVPTLKGFALEQLGRPIDQA